MIRRIDKQRRSCKRAFTLVELIVVLVILAVLAAALVPSLTGYIRRARTAKYIQFADEARVAGQAVFSEFYALVDLSNAEALGSDGSNSAANINWYTGDLKPYGDKVLQLLGIERGSSSEPYLLIIGVGHESDDSLHESQQTTVYYLAYMQTRTSPAIFYVNGEWTYRWPKDSDVKLLQQLTTNGMGRNTMTAGGETLPLRFYVICNRSGGNNYWVGENTLGTLQGNSQRRDGSYLSGVRF